MPYYEIKRQILAAPEAIFPILTNPDRLADGSFSILGIEGAIVEGQTIRLRSEADPKRTFAIKVSKVAAPGEMVWENGLPFGLFNGRRRFRLTAIDGGTEFHMREDYTGPLAGLMFRMIPDMMPTFEKFADGLKAAAEGTAA